MSFGCLGLHLWPHLLDRQLLDLPQAQRLARQSLQAPKAAEAVHGTAWGEALAGGETCPASRYPKWLVLGKMPSFEMDDLGGYPLVKLTVCY